MNIQPNKPATERFSKVTNPLTTIALFAGLAEAFCVSALPFLKDSIQSTFVWFVMGFPACLLAGFFVILWNRPKNLYAPSDYKNEDIFANFFGTPQISEITDSESLEAATEQQAPSELPQLCPAAGANNAPEYRNKLLDNQLRVELLNNLKSKIIANNPALNLTTKQYAIGNQKFIATLMHEDANQVVIFNVQFLINPDPKRITLHISRQRVIREYLQILTGRNIAINEVAIYDKDDATSLQVINLTKSKVEKSLDAGINFTLWTIEQVRS